MKRILYTLGIFSLIIILAEMMMLLYFVNESIVYNKQSKQYTEQVIPMMFTNWDWQVFYANASPTLAESSSFLQIEQLFSSLAGQIGGMKDFSGAKGKAKISFSMQGIQITANYATQPKFEKGYAEIKIGLVLNRGKWQLSSLDIASLPIIEEQQYLEEQEQTAGGITS